MGYSDRGHCPMLADKKCSIYGHRPQACRQYDCRIFAATGIAVDTQTQADIAPRVRAWVFDYETDQSRDEHAALKNAAAFLQNNRDLFPPGALPTQPAQMAALEVRIHRPFAGKTASDGASATPAAVASAIMAILTEPG